MMQLTPVARDLVEEVAQRHGVSEDAVVTLLYALVEGHGRSAQFNHPELGGAGQWMSGGMIMVGDMFNHGLKAKVDALCNELTALLADDPVLNRARGAGQSQSQYQGGVGSESTETMAALGGGGSLFVSGFVGRSGRWWPEELGEPSASGAQNEVRYAYFPEHRRLAVQAGGRTTLYDTGRHHITGVSQQQSHGASLVFVGSEGLVAASGLKVVEADEGAKGAASREPDAGSAKAPAAPSPGATATERTERQSGGADDIFDKIERLAALKAKGVLTEDEFNAKKAELLSRL